MKWYWWIVTLILALNALLIAIIAVGLGLAQVRKGRAARAEAKIAAAREEAKTEVK